MEMDMAEVKVVDKLTLKFIAFIFILFYSETTVAQWNFSLSTTQEYSSNPFRSVSPYDDLISTYNFGVEKEFENIHILYYGSYSNFRDATDISYYWHQVGMYGRLYNFMWGAYFEQRINKEANNYFDYQNYAVYLRRSFKFLDLNWTSNLAFNSMRYINLSDFDNWILSGNIKVVKSFQTKTTLIGTFIYNYKGFLNFNPYVDTTNGANILNYAEENVNVSQIEFNGRIAQSLFENTGLALNFNAKKILSGSGFGASLYQSTYGDMELYDDPISQDAYSVGAMLTQVFGDNIVLRLRYYYYNKSYPSQGAYLSETEYDKDILRTDEQNRVSSSLTKRFYLGADDDKALNLSLNFYLINNKSNSYYYNYKNNLFSASLNFQF